MTSYRAGSDRKIGAAVGAAVLQVALGWLVISGFTVTMPHAIGRDLKLFGVLPDPPPPPPPPDQPRPKPVHHRAAAAAPPNIRSKATEVVAPPPKIRMPTPPPIVAAAVAATGTQATSGAADKPGSGTGAGGVGTGSGGKGDGDGSGAEEAYQVSGDIKGSDYPQSALRAHFGGVVYVSFTVETTGRATGCVVKKTSGNPDIDATTCRLVEQRYRYAPARDASGRKIRSRVENQDHTWIVAHQEDDAGD